MGGAHRQQWTHHWCSIKKWGPCGMRDGAGGHVVVSHPFPRGGHKGGSNGNIQGPESVGTEEPAALCGVIWVIVLGWVPSKSGSPTILGVG